MSGITYSRVGDYYLPDITLNEPPPELAELLGRYGHLRQRFLRDHRTITYNTLLLSEQLFSHLRMMDKTATERLEAIMSDILAVSPPPDKAAVCSCGVMCLVSSCNINRIVRTSLSALGSFITSGSFIYFSRLVILNYLRWRVNPNLPISLSHVDSTGHNNRFTLDYVFEVYSSQ